MGASKPSELEALAAWFKHAFDQSHFKTQQELADHTNVDKSVISALKNGARLVGKDFVLRLAHALGTDKAIAERFWNAALVATRQTTPAQPAPTGVSPLVKALLEAQRRVQTPPYLVAVDGVPPLSKLYVEPHLESEQFTKINLGAVLALHRHVLITGIGGSGKTVLTLHVVAESADWWLDRPTEQPPYGAIVPVRVPAACIAGHTLSEAMAAAVRSELAELLTVDPGAQTFAQPPMDGTKWLVVVDGLDEILDAAQRQKVIDALAKHMSDPDTRHRFLITSRPLPNLETATLREASAGIYRLLPFDGDQLASFASRWFAGRAGREDAVLRFFDAVEGSRLRAELAVPLLATISLIVFDETNMDNALVSRASLYREFVYYMLHVRQQTLRARDSLRKQFRHYPGGDVLADWLFTSTEALLEHLATHRLKSDKQLMLETAEAWVVQQHNGIRRIPHWQVWVRDLLLSTGLLMTKDDDLQFLHQSFVEYLAAGPVAAGLSADLSGPTGTIWLRQLRNYGTRWTAVFALNRWAVADPSRDINAVVTRVLQCERTIALLAASIVRTSSAVTDETRRSVIRRLLQIADDKATEMGQIPPAWEAVQALGELPEHPDVAEALRRLAENTGRDARTRLDAAQKLIKYHGPEYIIRLSRSIANDSGVDCWGRMEAADELGKHGERRAANELLRIIAEDPQMWIRHRVHAANRLFKAGEIDDAVRLWVNMGAEMSTESWERMGAAWHLNDAGRPDLAIQIYRDIATDDTIEPGFRIDPAVSLAELGDHPTASAALLGIMRHPDATNWDIWEAAQWIFKFGGVEQSATTLMEVARNGRLGVDYRISAARILGKAGDVNAACRILAEIANDSANAKHVRVEVDGMDPSTGLSNEFEGDSRIVAARFLASFGAVTSAASSLAAIAEDAESYEGDRVAAVRELATLQPGHMSDRIIQILEGIVADKSAFHLCRVDAAEALAELDYLARALQLLEGLAEEPGVAHHERCTVGWRMLELGGTDRAVHVLSDIVKDPSADSHAKVDAAQWISFRVEPDDEVKDIILSIAQDSDAPIYQQTIIVEILERSDPARAVKALRSIGRNSSTEVYTRLWAGRKLVEAGDPEAADVLSLLLNDLSIDSGIRRSASEALTEAGFAADLSRPS